MIGAPLLLLIGTTGPFEGDGDLMAQVAPPARSETAAANVPQIKKRERKLRAVRRPRRNDITETPRALNLLNGGIPPTTEQPAGPNQ
jgi:hypothetical protein